MTARRLNLMSEWSSAFMQLRVRLMTLLRFCRVAPASALIAVTLASAQADQVATAAGVGVRVGAHGSFGRVVFLVPHGIVAQLNRQNDVTVQVSMHGAGQVPPSAKGTLNIASIAGGNDAAVLTVKSGARALLWQSTGKVVVDVYADQAAPAPRNAARAAGPGPTRPALGKPATAPVAAVLQEKIHAPTAQASPNAPAAAAPVNPAKAATEHNSGPLLMLPSPQPAPAPVPATLPVEEADNDGLVAARIAAGSVPELPADANAILVPFDRAVTAAAFGRAGRAHVIFSDSKPLDVAQLKDDAVFGSARVTLLPAATHLTLQLAPGTRLRLLRRPDGWVVAVVPQAASTDAAGVTMANGALNIAMPGAADTVVVDDDLTGDRLLVGTVRAEGPAVLVSHSSPEFTLLPSWLGTVVQAHGDRLALRAVKPGFVLGSATGPPIASVLASEDGQVLADAGKLTRPFDLLRLPIAVRRARLISDMGAAAATPKLARFGPRLRAAQDMLALGLFSDAASVLRVAIADDPSQAQNPEALALLAMADWLGGRGDGAAATASALGDSDEMALWRALLRPADSTSAASVANTWRLLLAYPEPLQRKLMPLGADIMLRGGQRTAAEALLTRFTARSLDPERAVALQLAGKIDTALAMLDGVGAGRDRKLAATALRDAVELRLANGRIKPAEAAASLDKHLYAWRDDNLEASQRMRIADLEGQSGAWRAALAELRETDALYPPLQGTIRSHERKIIADLLASGATSKMAPLDLVALVEENADLLAEKEASSDLAPVLVDKLLALDLPERADPLLGKLMAATQAPEAKAALGARLASLRLDQVDPAGAKAALAASDAGGLTPGLVSHRATLQARAFMAAGDENAAMTLLAGQDTAEALELRAGLLEKRKDWSGAETVLKALARASLPAEGALTDAQQDVVLRLASAASEAGDMAYLLHMQTGDAARLVAGPRADLFAALATQPVHALADLPRSGREAVAAKAMPAALARYDAH
jgi:hypothetical protein